MQKIIPSLWFDTQSEEAATFYTSVFTNSSIGNKAYYTEAGKEIHQMPPGSLLTIEFTLEGMKFIALNGGPIFKFNPSVSFLVNCSSAEEVETLFNKLIDGGTALMELGEYPFSKKYGWLQDKYGLSWQIMLNDMTEITQKIIPTMMFVGEVCGKAEEAMNLYTSIFKDTSVDHIMRYEKGEEPDKEGTIKHAGFTLADQQFACMDSAYEHKFAFNEAISFLVYCNTQEEIDYYWEKLTPGGDPTAQQCGWLKDKYGFSWQIAPEMLDEMIRDPDRKKAERVMNAFMPMHKIDIAELEKAYKGS